MSKNANQSIKKIFANTRYIHQRERQRERDREGGMNMHNERGKKKRRTIFKSTNDSTVP